MKKNKIVYYILSFSLILLTFLSVIDFWCFDSNFYAYEANINDTKEVIGCDDETLDIITDKVLGYLRDDYDSLDLTATINGENREVFDNKEKTHMVDVKNLYLNAMKVRNIMIIMFIISLIIFIGIKDVFKYEQLKKAFLLTIIIIIGFVLILGVWALIDFDNFWISFHKVFFTNDLFYLDPRYEVLIQLVPSQFFFDLVIRIIISFIILLGLYYLILYLLNKKVIKNDTYSTL